MNALLKNAFINSLHKRSIFLTDKKGEEIEAFVYFKERTFQDAKKERELLEKEGLDAFASHRIATRVLDENGNPIFKESDLDGSEGRSISDKLFMTLTEALKDFDEEKKKVVTKKT